MASFQHLTLEVHLPRVLRAACRCVLLRAVACS
jgi:hypothetical protein